MSDLAPFVAAYHDHDPLLAELSLEHNRLLARLHDMTSVEIKSHKRKLGYSNLNKSVEQQSSEFWRVPFHVSPSLSLGSLSSIEILIGGNTLAEFGQERVNCYFPDSFQRQRRNDDDDDDSSSMVSNLYKGNNPLYYRTMILESRQCCLVVLVQGVPVADWAHLEGLSTDLILPSLAYLVAISSASPQTVVRIQELYIRRRYIPRITSFVKPSSGAQNQTTTTRQQQQRWQ